MSLRSRMASGLAWNLVGSAFNQGSTFVVYILLSHLWGLRLFGEYAVIYTTLLASSAIAQLAMGYTATKYLAETRLSDPGRAGRILALTGSFAMASAFLAGAALFLGAPWIAGTILGNIGLVSGIRIAAGAVAFTVASGYLSGALAGLEAFRRLAVSGVTAGVFYVAACFIGARWGGLEGALWGVVVTSLSQFLLLTWLLRREAARQGIHPHLRGAGAERTLIVRFSLPAAIGSMFSMTAFWFANAALARQPRGYEGMALFTAANNWRTAVLFLPAILNVVGMSLLNAQRGQRDQARYRRVFWMNLALTLGIVLVAAVAALALGPWLLRFFGRAYVAGYAILVVLMGAAVAEAAVVAVYQLIQSQARIWLSLFTVVLPRDLTIVILAYTLCPGRGAVGLATAYAVGWSLALAAVITLAWRRGLALSAAAAQVPEAVPGGSHV